MSVGGKKKENNRPCYHVLATRNLDYLLRLLTVSNRKFLKWGYNFVKLRTCQNAI